MAQELDSLFEAVRGACKPAVWSRGVELARAGTVSLERSDGEEAVFQVALRGGMIARRVALFLDEDDWECACSTERTGCEHVAAAVIAWRQSREGLRALATASEATGRIGYRFSDDEGHLALERTVRRADGAEVPLETTLAAAARRGDGPPVRPSQSDLATELTLGTHRHGRLAPGLVPKLLARLAANDELTIEGRAVRASAVPVQPIVVVEDAGDGFRLRLVGDASVRRTFTNGAALCGDVRGELLRPTAAPRLSGRELHELAAGRFFSAGALAELVSAVLPSLRERVPVELRTERLPDASPTPPRIEIDLERDGERLSVLATLVYGEPAVARVDGGRLVHLGGTLPLRDEPAERRWLRRLQRELGLAAGVRETLAGGEAVAFCERLEAWEGRVTGEARRYFRKAARLVGQVELEGERFDVRFVSEPAAGTGGGRADPGRVLRAWREGDALVPLAGGGFAPLPADWLGRFGHRIADLLAARDAEGRLPRAAFGELAALCEELDRPPPPEVARLRDALRDFDGLRPATLPANLATPLRDYQRRGVDWLGFLRDAGLGALLADDMGLGKTLQALCAVRGRTLVVAPRSVMDNWLAEVARHRPGTTAAAYHGGGRRLDPAVEITVTTYALLRLDAEPLSAVAWDTVVLDEAQQIKNPESQVAAAAFALAAGWRLALTGTPIENRMEELWSQFHFINRGLLGGRSDFQARYADPVAAGDGEAVLRLRARIRPFILRRLKRDVAKELPPRTDMVLRCELGGSEREVYDAVHAATRRDVLARLGEGGGGVMAALEALLRLRQAACHPALVPGQRAESSAKLELLLESLDSVIAEGHRALVFSQWTSLLDLAEPALARAGIARLRLDGSTRDRAGVVARFQDEGGPPVLLVSLKAGGTGLNLTAADHVFLLDPWWNPAVEDQAADRAHRIGQERPVMVYRLVASDTVEEKILALQERKRELAGVALGEAAGAASLTREDLLDLLS